MRRLFAIFSLAFLAACSSQPPAPEQDGAKVDNVSPRDVGNVTPINQDGGMYGAERLKDPKSPLSKREIFFDLDSYAIRGEFQSLLEAHAKFLQANPKYKMLIQGNADDRGSREYNLALG
ncbi:MAG TPA: peptidoglycan-associated lipoprotein, partial [Rhodocyclaceae bacterium]|nr:peptidoglycan-associated lipoprotein [Rhodocyclaceae bacterium]